MKRNVLIIGAGGVAQVVAHKCAQNNDVLGDLHIASRTVAKCDAIIASVHEKSAMKQDGVFAAHQVDAMDSAAVAALIKDIGAQIVINVGAPFVNMSVLQACIDTGTAYIDTAIHEDPRKICETTPWYGNYEWKRRDACKAAGVTAILGAGFDPGMVNAFARFAADEFMDTVTSIDIVDINKELQQNSAEARRQATIYNADRVYWQVVSLKHKQRLAEGYLALVQKLSDDVNKMIEEGVATRSDGLSVEVKVNEAEMTLTKVNDSLVLARMVLCQTIGLPLNEAVILADEDQDNIAVVELKPTLEVETAMQNRPELKMLENGIDLSKQVTNLLKAGNLPMVAVTGGYQVTNPSVFNGFEKKFGGFWNVGVMMRVPIWNWGDVMYKVRARRVPRALPAWNSRKPATS